MLTQEEEELLISELNALGRLPGERGGNSSPRFVPGGKSLEINNARLSGYEQIDFPEADNAYNKWADTSLHVNPVIDGGSPGGGPTRAGGSDMITRDAFHTSQAGSEATNTELGFPDQDQTPELPDARVFSNPTDNLQQSTVTEAEVRQIVREELLKS
jgi:hypothetical protein